MMAESQDAAVRVPDGRHRERDVYERPVLAQAHRLVVLDALAGPDARQDEGLLVLVVGGDEDGHGLADDLVGRVAEDALGPAVPARDDGVERLGDDGVVGRVDDGRQPVGCDIHALRPHDRAAGGLGGGQRIYGRVLGHRLTRLPIRRS